MEHAQVLILVAVLLAGMEHHVHIVNRVTLLINEIKLCCIAICSVACVNGTVCSSPNICACPGGWSGSNCSTRKMKCCKMTKSNIFLLAICSNGCNNGVCTAPDTCVCSSGWNGTACDIRM